MDFFVSVDIEGAPIARGAEDGWELDMDTDPSTVEVAGQWCGRDRDHGRRLGDGGGDGDLRLPDLAGRVNTLLSRSSIRGSGSADEVVNNYVQGEITFDGHPAACRDNLGFDDRDRDHQLDEQEIAAAEPLDCG